MTTPVTDLVQLNQTSGFIELYILDCTALGGSIYRFTPNTTSTGTNISFAGVEYFPMPITTDGWDFTSTGTTPKPTLTISNVNKTLLNAVATLGDLVGATMTRYRTYEKYLDVSSTPRKNIHNYSEQVNNWSAVSACTIDADAVTSPTGTSTADRVVPSGSNSSHYVGNWTYPALAASTQYTHSVYAKAGGYSFLYFEIYGGEALWGGVSFDISNGTVASTTSPSYNAAIESVGDGWYRCSATFITAPNPASARVTNFVYNSAAGATFAGNASCIYLWGSQLELGTVLTSYEVTTTTNQIYADGSKFLGPDVYIVEQKTAHNKNILQWQMTSIIDRMGMRIPRRQVLKDKGFPGVGRTRIR